MRQTHELAKLARAIDWRFLEEKLGAVYTDHPGRPPLPTRLMAGLAILKHTFDLSDAVVCARWVENPYYQYFCGEEFLRHTLPLERSSITRWRNRMGEERLEAFLQESLAVATRTGAMKPSDLSRVIVDTTVQPKNITCGNDVDELHQTIAHHRPPEQQVEHGGEHCEARHEVLAVGRFSLAAGVSELLLRCREGFFFRFVVSHAGACRRSGRASAHTILTSPRSR
jgi:hypothetical protein